MTHPTPPAAASDAHPYKRIPGLQSIGDAADYLARHPDDDYAKQRLRESLDKFAATRTQSAQPSGVAGEWWSRERAHVANEFADMACEGLQWMRNVRDGISTPAEALPFLEANILRIKGLQDAEYANRKATPPIAQQGGVEDGWALLTKALQDLKMRHADNHQGDIYHAMQNVLVRYGKPWDGKLTQAALASKADGGEP